MNGQVRRRFGIWAACLMAAVLIVGPAAAQTGSDQQERTVKIRITFDDGTITATMENNGSARDFVSMLPMTVTLEDYASTEKVTDLPRRLDIADAPSGVDPSIGDINYYSPWGNLAIFYKDFGYSRGLVKLGTIEGDVGLLARPGPMRAEIDLIE